MNARPTRPSPPAVAIDRVPAWIAAGLIVAATMVAYRGTFSVPFVLDDIPSIADNLSIRHLATAWSPPPDNTTTGRPIVNLSLALNYAIGGLEVRSYHVFNLVVHLLAALTLFGIVRRTVSGSGSGVPPQSVPFHRRDADATWIALIVALLWAVHPLQTESVTYTIQRAESLMGLFYLLTVYAFIRGIVCHPLDDNGLSAHEGEKNVCHLMDDKLQIAPGVAPSEGGARCPQRAWFVISFLACLLGMATKEVMASAPLIVLLYDRTFVAGTFRAALRQRGRYYAALAATWLVLAALVISSEGRGGTAGLGVGVKIAPLEYALTQCHAVVHYLRLALWPAPLVFDYGKATVTSWSAIVAPALVLLALIGGTLFALRRKPILGFLGAWFFAILAPSSSVVPVATQTIAEHRMYLPLAAVLTLLVVALYRTAGRRVTLATTLAAAVGLTALASQRNAIYRDALTLWADTFAKAPDNPRAATNLGLALLSAGRVADAQQHFAAAVERQPNLADLRINYANVLAAAGQFDESGAQLEAALRLDPDSLEARNNLGINFAQRGRTAEAISHFERAIKIKPTSADSHRNLGLALAQAGRGDEALAQLAESVRLRPDDPIGHDFYGFALLQSGRLPEAIAELEVARRLDPQSARVRNRLGLAFASAGRMAEAVLEFEQAVKLMPEFTEAVRNLERARAESKP